MILPSKGVGQSKALLTVGGDILAVLTEPKTVSATWTLVRRRRANSGFDDIGFDWFVLALDLVFTLGAVEISQNLLQRRPTA